MQEAVITRARDFFDLLQKSSLLSKEHLAGVAGSIRQGTDLKTLVRNLVRDQRLTRWQAKQLLAGRHEFFLGKYKLLDELGSGGVGRVYLAEHVQMRRRVAIKTLTQSSRNDRGAISRFLSEARTIAALNHPNIIQAFDVDSDGDCYYLVMEYVEGKDLEQMVAEQGPLDYEVLADYVQQAADGLAHAHEQGIVHRDVKPANLLVDAQGTVKILDLGMARLVDDPKTRAESAVGDEMLGTVDYVSPEQALGGDNIDHRSDIYSLGCTMYFLLTGHPPFPEGSAVERLMKHQKKEPASIQNDRPDVPAGLAKICRKMMAKNPDERFASAEAVVEALEKWLSEHRRSQAAPAQPEGRRASPPAIGEAAGLKTRPSAAPPVRRGAPPPARRAAEPPPLEADGPPPPPPVLEPPPVEEPPAFDIKVDDDDDGQPALPPKLETSEEPSKSAAADANGKQPKASGLSRGKLVAMIGGGVAVLGLVVVGLVLAFAGGNRTEVAEADSKNQATADESSDGAGKQPAAAVIEDEDEDSDGSAFQGAFGDPTAPQPNDADEPAAGDPPASDPAEPQDQPGDNPPKTGNDEPVASNDPPKQPMPANPMPGDPPKEPADPPKEPADPPKEPADPPKEPTPPPPPADPFAALPAEVDLPPLADESADASSLSLTIGKVQLAADARCNLFLNAHQTGVDGQEFSILRANGNTAKRDWEISFVDRSEKTLIAKVGIRDTGEVVFQWTPEAVQNRGAEQLRNTIFRFQSGKADKQIRLRVPKVVEPLVVNFDDAKARSGQIEVEHVPDMDMLQFQVVKAEGFPKHVIQPNVDLPAVKAEFQIEMGEQDFKAFRVVVKTSAAGNKVKYDLSPILVDPNSKQVRRLTRTAPRDFEGLVNAMNLQLISLNQALVQMQKNAAKFKTQIPAAQAQQQELQRMVGEVQKIQEYYQQVNGKARIHFRIFMRKGTTEIDLLRTEAAAPAAATAEAAAAP